MEGRLGLDESLWDGWLRWMNRMIRLANGMAAFGWMNKTRDERMIRSEY